MITCKESVRRQFQFIIYLKCDNRMQNTTERINQTRFYTVVFKTCLKWCDKKRLNSQVKCRLFKHENVSNVFETCFKHVSNMFQTVLKHV